MKKNFLLGAMLLSSVSAMAQLTRPVYTGAPFLRISPDARSGALGDMGVATSPDAYSQYWNAAKYAFSNKYSAVGASYTPYLSSLVSDVNLFNIFYHTYLNDRSAIGASINYFSIGSIEKTDELGNFKGTLKPNEFAIDLSYSLRLTEGMALGTTLRYIRSDLFDTQSVGGANYKVANSFAVDISAYYESEIVEYDNFAGQLRLGANLSNIGPKLSYSDSQDAGADQYLPTNLRLGASYDFMPDYYNKVTLGVEVNKLMVPTSNVPVLDGNGNAIPGAYSQDTSKGVLGAMFSSFNDAPDGLSEEMKEVTIGTGVEYWYNEAFAARLGYFYENADKGNRQYITLGAGFKYDVFGLNVSYLVPTSDVNSPLENSLRFSLVFNFGGDAN